MDLHLEGFSPRRTREKHSSCDCEGCWTGPWQSFATGKPELVSFGLNNTKGGDMNRKAAAAKIRVSRRLERDLITPWLTGNRDADMQILLHLHRALTVRAKALKRNGRK